MKIPLRILFSFFFFSLLVSSVLAQPVDRNYQEEWKKVDEYIAKQLPRSALAEVKKIYALAKKARQQGQQIKALVYTVQLQNENREDNEVLGITELENEISGSQPIPASILRSIVASAYWQYYQNNRWKFYNRTNTVNFDKKDIATWTLEDLFIKISSLYLASLKDEKLLQQTNLASYDAVIEKGNVRHLRPTLYDLLAFEALDFFQAGVLDIKKPAYSFELDQSTAFAPATDFINIKFSSKDTISSKQKAIQIYQRLLTFHLKDPKPDALLDADIHRIHFVHENSIHPEKDKLYLSALENITSKYGILPSASMAYYYMAQYYTDRGNEYKAYGDSTHRFDLVKAKEICEKLVVVKDSSEGKFRCFNLLQELTERSMDFKLEKVNVPGQPFRALVNYQNFSSIHFRIIAVNKELRELLSSNYEQKYWPTILAAKPIRTWKIDLPLPSDLQTHSAEVKVDALPVGEYMLVASDTDNLYGSNALIGARYFYVSGISFINNNDNYFVLDRESGSPLANAKVQAWEQRYEPAKSKYVTEKAELYTTDANGYFLMKSKKYNKQYYSNSIQLEITHGNDKLYLNDLIRDYYYYGETRDTGPVNSIFLFTDRSIYRPGQQVFFKGIVLNRVNEKKAEVNADYSTTIILRDANYKEIDSIVVKTNEYGSFNGRFNLPSSGLNGNFSIFTRKDNASADLKVEDYKRPKFYVDYEPIKGTYKVNDKIKVTGFAKAYAGNNIDGAKLAYRVVRRPRFIYTWMFWRWWQPPTEQMEIAHGETKTGKDGKFTIEFTAIPDLSIDRKFEPVFDYTVYADVTDINGETRSAEKQVSVSYKALQLYVSLPSTIEADSLKKFYVSTTNLNGEYQLAQVQVNMVRLKPEKRLIRDRYWDRPDQFVISKAEYIQNFPHDEYDNEADPRSWEKSETVYAEKDSSRKNGDWILASKQFTPGFYQVEVKARDNNGDEVTDIQYLEITGKEVPPAYLWKGPVKTYAEPGDTALVQLGTAAENVFLIQEIKRDNSREIQAAYSFTKLSKEKRSFLFPLTEADRGGFGVGWLFVKNNRYYQWNHNISVPWTNKDLQIEYSTFRDKSLPGSQEKWKIRIKGNKNEKLAAEMLASMYDASLDQFYPHNWSKPSVWPSFYNNSNWTGSQNFEAVNSIQKYTNGKTYKTIYKEYDNLISWNIRNSNIIRLRGSRSVEDQRKDREFVSKAPSPEYEILANAKGVDVHTASLRSKTDSTGISINNEIEKHKEQPGVRKNFNETAFFYPELKTDSTGSIEFSFTLPEALTRWKFMALAHTKDASFGYSTKEIITQKELMVQPNPPRFLREGDKMEFSSKIVNLTDKEFTGIAQLQLFDATTNESVDGWFRNMIPKQYFTVAAGQSEVVLFPIEVPYLFNKALAWRIVASSGNLSDGEENMLPVLTNRMLVTESLPLNMREPGQKDFRFEKLISSGDKTTLQHHALTIEYTSNPAWYAIQALPYLMEYPYECAEQNWNRYYANALASYISNSSPRIKQVFDKWRITDTAALMSNLQKNQELKAVLLEETPWVMAAKNEAEQKKNIALLFDMVKMAAQLDATYAKLKQMQLSNGGFVWFTGGPDDRYITQYIITGIGHLQNLKALSPTQQRQLDEILKLAVPYLDNKARKDYDDLVKTKADLKKYQPGYSIIQYLYMRSFFRNYPISKEVKPAFDYFRSRIQQSWTGQSKYMQAMIALALHRTNDTKTPAAILRSLKETAVVDEEMGMYYKNQSRGWWWYQAPVETQALVIEAFDEITKDTKTADNLRTWLLKNKQTNNWSTTKATAEACYALLLRGTSWIENEPVVSIKLGNTVVNSTNNKQEAGTGYFKTVIDGKNVHPEMGNISVTVTGTGSTWGAAYWQYFEDLDKISSAATPLSLKKKLFVEKNSDRGPLLTPVNDGDVIKVGDKIKVRIELRVDRDMEYVHMKDMRASSLEPVNVLSGYKWQGGLGYYESTRDASTNFFFNYLPKGTYVFEYPLFVTHAGNFSNGISSIQCMYAPEFAAHSEGIRISIE